MVIAKVIAVALDLDIDFSNSDEIIYINLSFPDITFTNSVQYEM